MKKEDVVAGMLAYIAHLREVGRYSTAKSYLDALRSFKCFCGMEEIPYAYIDKERLLLYQAWLSKRGCMRNTVSTYMRRIRHIYNLAVEAGEVSYIPNLFKNFPLAIILMIAILIMLFKDYRKPAIIFCSIPMVFVGVVMTMLVTGKTFNFVAIVGTLGLIGMIIKNGIVLMDEITLQIGQGTEPVTALIDSAQSRLRPVMMAALTTILGMIPLLTDAMFGSLAASIMGGLLFGTVITLVFIPVLYALFFHIKHVD